MRALLALTAALLAWTYGGYLAFLRAIASRRRLHEPAAVTPTELPAVTILVIAHNEENTIADKIDNSLALEYPEHLLDVIVASDGSTDRTNEIAAAHPSPHVRLLEYPERRGKALTTNDAMAAATGDWVVVTDAETRFEPDAVKQMARHFGDPSVGMVDAELVCANRGASSMAADVGIYWRFESALKKAESDLGILSSTFGSCSALRRSLFEPLRATEDVDFRTALDVAANGDRIVHEPRAKAAEVTHSGLRDQYQARVRMVTKNLPGTIRGCDQRLWSAPLLLLGVVSHKLLRWFTPLLLLANCVASIGVARRGRRSGVLAVAAHVALLSAAAVGGVAWRQGRRLPLASSVFSFMVANAGFLVGITNSVRGVRITAYGPSQELYPGPGER